MYQVFMSRLITNSVFVLLVRYFPQSFSSFFFICSTFFFLSLSPYYSSFHTVFLLFYFLFQISQIINLLTSQAEINFSFLSTFWFCWLLKNLICEDVRLHSEKFLTECVFFFFLFFKNITKKKKKLTCRVYSFLTMLRNIFLFWLQKLKGWSSLPWHSCLIFVLKANLDSTKMVISIMMLTVLLTCGFQFGVMLV